MSGIKERRYSVDLGIELRKTSGKAPVMAGHAAVFNSRSQNLGGFYEVLDPECFSDALNSKDLECYSLFNHDESQVLGVTTNGSLRVSQDKTGLYQETDIDMDCPDGSKVARHVEKGRITRMSFAMMVAPAGSKYSVDANNDVIRNVQRVSVLADTSPVTYAAYQAANVGMRSALGETGYCELLPLVVRAENNLKLGKTDFDTLRDWEKRIKDLLNLETKMPETPMVSRRSLLEIQARFDGLL